MDGGEGADSPRHGGGRPTSPGGMNSWKSTFFHQYPF
jgi:hypothetical protein